MFRKRLCPILIALTLLFLVMRTIHTTAAASATAANNLLLAPPVRHLESVAAGDYEWLEGGGGVAERTNWSGYAIQTSDYAVSQVHGSWFVPTVTCSGGTENSSVWLGIDGYNSNTVEQLGTEQDCRGETAHYFAWYEMYPAGLVTLSLPVHGGDQIQANIQYVGNNQFALELTNLSTGDSFFMMQSSNNAQRSSAEWIVEAPGVLPLADFGAALFANSLATISGTTGTISSFSRYTSLNMVALTGAVKTQTFGLSKGGANFTVVWYRP
jgi:hypothetical protein